MKTIIILRHAKSDWFADSNTDFDRPLNGKGLKDGRKIGVALAEKQLMPEIVLCSPALRTRETLDLILPSLHEHDQSGQPVPQFVEAIYQADPQTLREIIAGQANELGCIMIVAHNPGLEMLIQQLTGHHIELKPAYVAIVRCNAGSWQETVSGEGKWQLVDILRP